MVLKMVFISGMLVAGLVVADTGEEINHLLNFVAETECQYERNGTFYNGPEARDHIKMKYKYYMKKVKTTEDFIKYSATKSTMSGKKYRIHCPDTEVMDASDWLLNELQVFRMNGKE